VGPADGISPRIYTATATGEPQRRYSHVASETAVVGEYVAFIDSTPYLPNGCCTVVRAVRSTGTARDLLSFGTQVGTLPFALTGVGRRAFYLRFGAAPSGTIELDPEGRGHRDVSTPARFALPLSTNSIAATGSRIDLYLDAEGIKRLSRPLYGVPG